MEVKELYSTCRYECKSTEINYKENFRFEGPFKGTVSRDFLDSIFFHKSAPSGPIKGTLAEFHILTYFRGVMVL